MSKDERLAERASKGDERAFAAIFRRYGQDLYRYCLATLGNPQDAEEAVQSTMEKALRALPGEDRRIELKPWLYRIAHNESIDMIRRRRETDPAEPDAIASGPSLAATAETRARLTALIADLGELPERQRGAVVMRELAGMSFEEIGSALETSPAVARQTLYEARLGLRQAEEGREMTCDEVKRALSDGDGRVVRRRDIRSHLRSCADCSLFRDEIARRSSDLAAISPLPAVAAAGLLQGLLGGSGGASGAASGAAGALGAGAAKSVGAGAALKAGAAVAAVAVVGTVAADRGGLIETPIGGGDSATESSSGPEPGKADGGASDGSADENRGEAGSGAKQRSDSKRDGRGPDAAASPTRGDSPATGRDGEQGQGQGASNGNGASQAQGAGKNGKGSPSHGKETSAAHKNGGKGSGKRAEKKPAGHPSHPAHPAKPEHPSKPEKSGGSGGSGGAAGGNGGSGSEKAAESQQTPEATVPVGAEEPSE